MTAVAQTPPPTRIRGTIDAETGKTLTIKTREGPTVEVTLNDKLTVLTVKRLTLDDVKQGSYVGLPAELARTARRKRSRCMCCPKHRGAVVRATARGTCNPEA